VARILAMTTVRSLADAKNGFSQLVTMVMATHERVVVTKNGIPAAVLISPDDLASLEETLAILTDQDTMAAIRQSEAEIGRGERVTRPDLEAVIANRRTSKA
jgi:antitoxin YefM